MNLTKGKKQSWCHSDTTKQLVNEPNSLSESDIGLEGIPLKIDGPTQDATCEAREVNAVAGMSFLAVSVLIAQRGRSSSWTTGRCGWIV